MQIQFMDSQEIDKRLITAGVRVGNPQRAIELIKAWSVEDGDPEGTVEEWEEIQRNIEQGTIDLGR